MKKKIINGLLFAAALLVATSSFVSCKDYEGDDAALQKEQNVTLWQALTAQQKAMEDYCKTADCEAARLILQNRLDALETLMNNGGITTTNDIASKAWVLEQLQQNGSAIQNAVETIITNYFTQNGTLSGLPLTADGAIDLSKFLQTKDLWAQTYNGTALKDVMEKYSTFVSVANAVNDPTTGLAATNTTATEAKAAAETAQTAAEAAQAAAEAAQETAKKAWDFVNETKDKDGKEFKTLQDLYDALNSADESLAKDIQELDEKLDELKNDIENIIGSLQRLVTSIELQGATNPVFGYFATPFGVQSNVLAAYYGKAVNAVQFPTSKSASYFTNQSIISDDELALIAANGGLPAYESLVNDFPANETIINEEEGNAGKLYLTVNPSNAKFDGTKFTLRTSDNEVSKVALSPLATSTDRLYFGWNRAASQNGFYEAKATITAEEVKNIALPYDLKNIVQKLRDAITIDRKNYNVDVNLAGIADLILDNVSEVSPRYGVQYNWKDTTGNKSLVSEYGVAATAVRPLSFDLAYGWNRQWIKYIDGAAIDNELREMLALELNLDPLELGKITVASNGKVTVNIIDKKTGENVKDTEGNEIIADITAQVNEIYTTLNTALQKYNDKVDDINKLPETIAKAVDGMGKSLADKASNFLNNYISKVNKFITKANNRINDANRLLQPAILAESQNGTLVQLSQVREIPTTVASNDIVAFWPTTYTLELIAPAYLKHVAVSNVFDAEGNSALAGNAACAAAMTTANGIIGSTKLLKGQKDLVVFTGAKAGYTYEIVYTALDYSGQVAGKKYYVKVN